MKSKVKYFLSLMILSGICSCGHTDTSSQVETVTDGTDTVSVVMTPVQPIEASVRPDSAEAEFPSDAIMEVIEEMKEEVKEEPQSGLSIVLAGDIMMGTTFPDDTPRLPANGGRNLFDAVKPVFADADIVCANLEGVLMEPGGEARKMGKDPKTYYIFRMPTAYVYNLVDAGVDFVSVANNHANDMQEAGRRSTQRVLSDAGIAYAGQTNCPTVMIERGSKKIGVAAFGHSSNTCHTWNYDRVRRTVEGLDSVCDIVIVSFHGGAEGAACGHVPHRMETYLGEERGDVEKFAHAAIDAGADVVYGHGPHVTRAAELYKDRIIVYSLGNFCTPFRVNISGVSGYAPVVTVDVDGDGKFIGGKIHSFIQQPGRGPQPDTTNRVARHMRQLSEEDFPLSPLRIAGDGTIVRREAPRQ